MRLLLPGLLLAITLLALPAAPAAPPDAPPWPPALKLTESVEAALGFAEDRAGYGYDGGVCLLAGYVRIGESLSFTRRLEKGESYMIVGGGDGDAVDLDLSVEDANDKTIAVDTEDDATPYVEFKAPKGGRYTVTVRLAAARPGKRATFATLIFLRRGGSPGVDPADLRATLGRLAAGCATVKDSVQKKVAFPAGDGRWAVYGVAPEPEDPVVVPGVKFGEGERMVLAYGGAGSEDVDLAILDGSGAVQLRDKTREPFAFLKFNEDDDEAVRDVRVTNARSRKGKAALVLTAVLNFGE
jgi:hypothetical protein